MRKAIGLRSLSAALAATAMLSAATSYGGELHLYSWEAGLEGWSAANVTLGTSTTLGVTDGVQSMLIDNQPSGFKNNAGLAQVVSGPVFNKLNLVGTRLFAGDTDLKLEFDFSYDHTNATNLPQFGQLAMFTNSTTGGFTEYKTGQLIGGNLGANFPALDPTAVGDGVTLTPNGPNSIHIAIPLGVRLVFGPGTFFQIGFKANGGWGGSVDWAIDNMTVTGANIPEPASIALVSMAGLAVLGLRCRRRQS